LLDELLVRIRDVLDVDTCAVLLLDAQTNDLVPRAAKGLEDEVEQSIRIPLGKGFAGRIAAERRPIVLEDVQGADIYNPLLREKGIASLLGVPLLVKNRVLGILHAGTLERRRFGDEDVELLQLVADRVALALERALIYDELVRLDELKTDFIAVASHELRTPASTIYGAAATLAHHGSKLSEDQRADLVTILFEQTERLRHLVDQLLDLSRLEAGKIRIRPRRFAARPRVGELVSLVAAERAGDVELDVSPELELVADSEAFDRIVSNLVANALRHGDPPVVVSATRRDGHYRVAVEDRGRGVRPEFVPHLFDRFARSAGSGQAARGAGLGLAIARAYARAHGGELTYVPAEPHGARFELVLPRPSDA
jgi:signal transduction histidine kinase